MLLPLQLRPSRPGQEQDATTLSRKATKLAELTRPEQPPSGCWRWRRRQPGRLNLCPSLALEVHRSKEPCEWRVVYVRTAVVTALLEAPLLFDVACVGRLPDSRPRPSSITAVPSRSSAIRVNSGFVFTTIWKHIVLNCGLGPPRPSRGRVEFRASRPGVDSPFL